MARTTALTKLSSNCQVVVPKPVRVALGLKSGDLFEATATRDGVLLRPKVLIDRATFLKQLKKDIEASEAAVKAGRILEPTAGWQAPGARPTRPPGRIALHRRRAGRPRSCACKHTWSERCKSSSGMRSPA